MLVRARRPCEASLVWVTLACTLCAIFNIHMVRRLLIVLAILIGVAVISIYIYDKYYKKVVRHIPYYGGYEIVIDEKEMTGGVS